MWVVLVSAILSTGVEASAGLQVYDAKSQFLGQLMDIHPNGDMGLKNTVVKLFVVKLGRSLVIDTVTGRPMASNAAVWFASRRCAGAAYVDSILYYSIAPYGRGFVTGADHKPAQVGVQSLVRLDRSGSLMCETLALPLSIQAVPAEKLESLPFQVPVELPLGFFE
jgi:hypothetical protein